MSELDDLKKEAVERIYLIPDRDDGRLRYVWCDDPSPEYGMRDDDAVEYVRRDKYDALAAHVERLRRGAEAAIHKWSRHPSYTHALAPLEEALAKTPTTSLARLKAQWQAEALELFDPRLRGTRAYTAILDEIAEIRRQADPDLCVDEGCPHRGTPHVCINRQADGGE